MRKLLAATAALALSAGIAHAGGLAVPVEPEVMPAAPALAPMARFDWTGPYAGLNLSYGRAQHGTDTLPGFWPNGSGFGAGALAGYNWQSGNTVFGLEGHVSAQRMRGSTEITTSPLGAVGTVRTDLNTLASLRGRVGFAADRTLFFVSAGPAAGRVNHTAVDLGLSESNTVHGAMVGVGVEQALAGGLSVRGDLEHYRFRSRDFDTAGPGTFPGVRTSATVARVGAVFRF